MTSSIAEVTHVRDWQDMIAAAHLTAARIAQLREYIAGLRGGADADRDATEGDIDAERERERLDRLDYESDFDLDGDYTVEPPPDAEPELDR